MSDVQDASQDSQDSQDASQDASPDDDGSPESPAPPAPVRYRLRRAPRYRAFGLTGVVIGVIIGLAIAFSRPADGDYSAQTIAGYFAASFGLIGALAGLGAAVLADRRRR